MKNKETNKTETKILKKELKKNLKEIKKERKKAIKKVKQEKEKAIQAIKNFVKSNPFNTNNEVFEEKKEEDRSETISNGKLEKKTEDKPLSTPINYKSVDLKADEAIARINTLDKNVDIDSFISMEKRSTILKAADKKKSELTQ